MKVADMYRGMEVAVRRHGYESWRNYQKGTITTLRSGGGHAQTHTVTFEDGTTAELYSRRIMKPWSQYWSEHGDYVKEQEERQEKTKLHAKLREQYREIQKDQADRIVNRLLVIGLEATADLSTRWDPAEDNSFAYTIRIHHLDKLEQLLEPIVQARLTSMFNPESKPLDTQSDAE